MNAFQLAHIDIFFLLLIGCLFLAGFMAQRRIRRLILKIEEKLVSLEDDHEKKLKHLEGESAWLKEVLFEKINSLSQKIEALGKTVKLILKEVEKRMEPVKGHLDNLQKSTGTFQEIMRKRVSENEKETAKLRKELGDFSREIARIKENIRERSIDLEV